MKTKGETGKDRRGLDKKRRHTFSYLLKKSGVVSRVFPWFVWHWGLMGSAQVPCGGLGFRSPFGSFFLGSWSWLWFVATSLVLDSRTQAQLSRGLWVSEYAVLLCPLRTRIVQSFVNYEKNRNWDSPYGTCVMEPSPCQNPLPVQVEEMEVWSGLVFSLREPTLAPS